MQATTHHFASIRDARFFAFAGNAIITLESLKSGAHYTYKIQQATDKESGEAKPGMFFVKLLTSGSADEGEFTYIGMVMKAVFRLTKASKTSTEAPSVKAFAFFMSLQELHPALVIRHEGRCGRCNRTLTVPESIDRGIGPDCAVTMGMDL